MLRGLHTKRLIDVSTVQYNVKLSKLGWFLKKKKYNRRFHPVLEGSVWTGNSWEPVHGEHDTFYVMFKVGL